MYDKFFFPAHVNGWEMCGGDGVKYSKALGNREFHFISREWLDGETPEYAIVDAIVDMKKLSLHDIEIAICGSFDGIADMEERTGCVLGELDDIIAAEYFDTNCIHDGNSWGGTFTEEEANTKILEFMLEN